MQDEVDIDIMMPDEDGTMPEDGDGTRGGPIFTDIVGSSSTAITPFSLFTITAIVLALLLHSY